MDICKWPQHTHYANWRVGQLSCPSNFGNGVVGCLWLYDLPDDISCLLTGFDYRRAKLLFLPTVLCWLTWLPWTKKGEMRTRLLTLVLIGPLSIRWTHSTSYICSELQQIASHFKRVISRQWHSCLEYIYPVYSEADKPKLRLFSQLIVTPTPYNMGLNGDAAFG